MSYSQYFNFDSDPTLQKVDAGKKAGFMSVTQLYRDRVVPGRADEQANEEFDAIMAGHDATTEKYTNTLRSIYDGYSKYAKDYEGNVQPLIDSMTGDIENMSGYIDNYDELLLQNKDTFLSGIVLDPNASRTRSEYTNATSDYYENAEDKLKRDSLSQGRNPYENKGSIRDMAMEKAKALGGASGQAYTDWRESYNQDKVSQQNAVSQFIGMQGKAIEGQQGVIDAKRGISDIYGNILNSKIGADKERATGIEGLTSLSEARRQEALALGQQQQENTRNTADITQQLSAKLKNGGLKYHSFM